MERSGKEQVRNPFYEAPWPKVYYHPSPERNVNPDLRKKSTLSPEKHHSPEKYPEKYPERYPDQSAAGYQSVTGYSRVTQGQKSPGSSELDESWPDTERSSASQITFAGAKTSSRTDLYDPLSYSPEKRKREKGGGRKTEKAETQKAEMEKLSGEEPVISRYLNRFRFARPASREDRRHPWSVNQDDFWWRHAAAKNRTKPRTPSPPERKTSPSPPVRDSPQKRKVTPKSAQKMKSAPQSPSKSAPGSAQKSAPKGAAKERESRPRCRFSPGVKIDKEKEKEKENREPNERFLDEYTEELQQKTDRLLNWSESTITDLSDRTASSAPVSSQRHQRSDDVTPPLRHQRSGDVTPPSRHQRSDNVETDGVDVAKLTVDDVAARFSNDVTGLRTFYDVTGLTADDATQLTDDVIPEKGTAEDRWEGNYLRRRPPDYIERMLEELRSNRQDPAVSDERRTDTPGGQTSPKRFGFEPKESMVQPSAQMVRQPMAQSSQMAQPSQMVQQPMSLPSQMTQPPQVVQFQPMVQPQPMVHRSPRKADDILQQWRLKRKMEQARVGQPFANINFFGHESVPYQDNGPSPRKQSPSVHFTPTKRAHRKLEPELDHRPVREPAPYSSVLPPASPHKHYPSSVLPPASPHKHYLCDILPCQGTESDEKTTNFPEENAQRPDVEERFRKVYEKLAEDELLRSSNRVEKVDSVRIVKTDTNRKTSFTQTSSEICTQTDNFDVEVTKREKREKVSDKKSRGRADKVVKKKDKSDSSSSKSSKQEIDEGEKRSKVRKAVKTVETDSKSEKSSDELLIRKPAKKSKVKSKPKSSEKGGVVKSSEFESDIDHKLREAEKRSQIGSSKSENERSKSESETNTGSGVNGIERKSESFSSPVKSAVNEVVSEHLFAGTTPEASLEFSETDLEEAVFRRDEMLQYLLAQQQKYVHQLSLIDGLLDKLDTGAS